MKKYLKVLNFIEVNMNEIALDKIIRKVVYPKYPYIVDHEIIVLSDDGDASWGIKPSKRYVVDLYVGTKESEDIDMEDLLKDMDQAKKLVEHLAELLGIDRNETIGVHYSSNANRE